VFWGLRGEPVAVAAYEVEPAANQGAWLSGPAVVAFAGARPEGGEVLSGFALTFEARLTERLSLGLGPAILTTPDLAFGAFFGATWRF
jgi:hypothetical protein